MKIRPFAVEQWMNEYEMRCVWNLAETCVDSLTIAELLALAGQTTSLERALLPLRMTYGAIDGTDRLRDLVASLYDRQTRENIVVTHGAIGANHLLYLALVEPGDVVVSIQPAYQQHSSIPASLGADVRFLHLRPEARFLPDLDELRSLAGRSAKLIVATNPNNPTGALMDRATLESIADIAAACGAYVLCDEVYRGSDQDGGGTTASMADIYERGISAGSMSKVFSLAGLRLGWLAGPEAVLRAVSVHRDYNTISVSMLDDLFACVALEARAAILSRTRRIVREHLAILDAWVAGQPLVSYVKPRSGTTAFLKYDLAVPSRDLCVRLLETTGVMLTPGSAFDMEGWLRLGYANNRDVLVKGLDLLGQFLAGESR